MSLTVRDKKATLKGLKRLGKGPPKVIRCEWR